MPDNYFFQQVCELSVNCMQCFDVEAGSDWTTQVLPDLSRISEVHSVTASVKRAAKSTAPRQERS